jgi:hypothetical protein
VGEGATVTSKDAAMEIAEKRLEEHVQPIIDELEPKIQEWLGPPGQISVHYYNTNTWPDVRVIEVVKELYQAAGWEVETVLSSSYRSIRLS